MIEQFGCTIPLTNRNDRIQCYNDREGIKYIHKADTGGPVCANAVVVMEDNSQQVVTESYSLFAGKYYNEVRTVPSKMHLQKGALVAPGMQKNEKETVRFNEKQGYLATQALTEEYGTIGLALVWNPSVFAGMAETNEGRFIKLKPSADGSVRYLSIAVWFRGSSEQPSSMDALVKMADELAQGFRNPVIVEIK